MENQPKSTRIILGLALGTIIILMLLSYFSPVNRAVQKGERVNILLLGCDNVENSRRADVLMLFSFRPREKFVDLVSIPRDSRVRVPQYKLLRINEFYAYGYKEGGLTRGAELTRDTVQNWLQINIPYYIQMDFADAIRIIDALGGVDIDIPEKMDYDDQWGKLHIHFLPGRQTLDGQKALEYLRFRKDFQGDLGRMQRNRSFLKAVSEKIKSPAVILRLPQIMLAGIRSIHSNLSFYDLVTLLFESRELTAKSFRQQQLPGRPATVRGAWVWEIDQARLEKVLQLLNEEVPREQAATKTIRVELWNATRDREATQEMTRYLRSKGVDVLTWGYYEKKLPHCKIIDRTGNPEITNFLGGLINCQEVETSLNETDNSITQAVIIIGADWRKNIAL